MSKNTEKSEPLSRLKILENKLPVHFHAATNKLLDEDIRSLIFKRVSEYAQELSSLVKEQEKGE